MKNNLLNAFTVLVALSPFMALAQVSERPGFESPGTIIVPVEQKPIQKPKEAKVVVIKYLLDFQKGELMNARVRSQQFINSTAPKVFARQGGDWIVTLEGEQSVNFFVYNPGALEAEEWPKQNRGLEIVPADGQVEWSLVVPLNYQGSPIQLRRVVVRDARTNKLLFSTDVS